MSTLTACSASTWQSRYTHSLLMKLVQVCSARAPFMAFLYTMNKGSAANDNGAYCLMMNSGMINHRERASGCKIGIAKRLVGVLAGFTLIASAPATALESVENLNQAQFLDLARNLGAATHYKSISPSEPLGPLGFDIGMRVSSTDIDGILFDLASDGDFDGATEAIVPSVSAHKGLFLGLDVGASVGAIPGTDGTVVGAEVRYAIVKGDFFKPSIGVRASYSEIKGLDDFTLDNKALELGISKGFLFITPYAGVGIVQTNIDGKGISSLGSESEEQRKLFVGATINLGLAITLEAEQTGDFRTYAAKAGFRF